MTELSQLILKEYQTRRTKKQKLQFIELLKKYIPDLKVQEGGFLHNRNIIVGDLEKSKVVIGAHYDTCALLPVPNFIMPKRIILSILYSFVLIIPIFILSFLLGFGLSFVIDDPTIVSMLSSLIMLLIVIFGMLIGIPSKHTANDNTSGIITLIELILSMSEEERKNVTFVFFDNEENGLFGSSFFASKYKNIMKDKLLINLDCVSDGDNMLVIHNKLAQKQYGELITNTFKKVDGKDVYIESSSKTYYPSDQLNFKKYIAISFMNKCKLGLYMNKIHTNKDIVFDEKNIEFLCIRLKEFIKEI